MVGPVAFTGREEMDILVIDKFSDWSMQRYCKRTVRELRAAMERMVRFRTNSVGFSTLRPALRGLLLILSRPE